MVIWFVKFQAVISKINDSMQICVVYFILIKSIGKRFIVDRIDHLTSFTKAFLLVNMYVLGSLTINFTLKVS